MAIRRIRRFRTAQQMADGIYPFANPLKSPKLISAIWGIGTRTRDVIEQIRQLRAQGKEIAVNPYDLYPDPAHGVSKELVLTFSDGQTHRLEEGEILSSFLDIIESGNTPSKFEHQSHVPAPISPKISKTDMQRQAIKKILPTLKSGRGMFAKEIADKLAKRYPRLKISESTIRRHILPPMMKAPEITNTPGIGYHLLH
ncbi:MAG: hypothetical protein ABSD28_07370 [Tepidisphaeraceae bacterium]|jgi:hypothetical protein